MFLWTVQKESVIEQLLVKSKYEPNFLLSDGLANDTMKKVYPSLLSEYNSRNSTLASGLIFGLTNLNNAPILSIQQYHDYFTTDSDFWSSVSAAGSNWTVLQLEIPDFIDSIHIFFQDFIILSMRYSNDNNYKMFIKSNLYDIPYCDFHTDLSISQNIRWVSDDIFKSILQAHFHQIDIKNVRGVYSTYDPIANIEYDLTDGAKQLKNLIETKSYNIRY